MPTMAKLFSAVLLGALGYLVADRIGFHMGEEERQNYLRIITPLFGGLVGWKFLGPRVRGDWGSALGLGLSSGLVLAVVCLFWFAGYEMLRKALRMAYGGNVMEALEDMFEIAVKLAQHARHTDVIMMAVLGSLCVGVVVTGVARRWG